MRLGCKVSQVLPVRGTTESIGLGIAAFGHAQRLINTLQLALMILLRYCSQAGRNAAATAAAAHSAADDNNGPAAAAAARASAV